MAEAPENLPSGASRIAQVYPDIWTAFATLGQACSEAGPIEGHTLPPREAGAGHWSSV